MWRRPLGSDSKYQVYSTISASVSKTVESKDRSPFTKHSGHKNLICFLSLSQQLQVDLLDVTWEPRSDLLGRGGTAIISPAAIDSEVGLAFKRFSPGVPKGTELQRVQEKVYLALIAEISILCHLAVRAHPNIIDLEGVCWEIDSSSKESPVIWPVLVFERANLGSLDKYLLNRSVEHNVKLGLMGEILSAVAFMHSIHGVHGDIKPSNILIYLGERGQVTARLGDFGYSTLGIETGICLPLSRGWNAPEVDDPRKEWTSSQARKADIFSLGLVCLWILTATGANASSTEADGTIWSLSVQALVRTGELTGYIQKLLLEQDITPEDQRGFVDFFLLALKIDPEERTDSISRLLEVFGNKRHLCVRQSLRHPTLGSANFDAPRQCTSINTTLLIYNLKQVDYRVRRYVAGCLASIVSNPICKECANDAAFVLALFSSIGFGTPKDDQETQKLLRLSARSLEELQEAIQRILNINSDPIVQQSPFNEKLDRWRTNGLTIGSIKYHSANALETFVDALKQEVFELETALGPENAVVYTTKWALAELFQARGQFTQCEALLKSLIKRLVTDEIYGDSCHQTLIMKSALASLYQDMGRYAQAIELQATVVEKYEALFGVTHWWSLDAKGTLADMYATDGHHSIAESIIAPVCQEWERQFETDSLHYAWGLTMWANALHGVGKVHTAKEKMQTAIMMYTEKLGEFHLDTLHANRQLAGICLSMDESVAAEDLLQQTKYGHELTITEGECPPDYLSTLVKLSGVLAGNGHWKEAKALTEKAMSYVQNLYPAESTEFWQCLDSQNYIKRHQKDWQQVNSISREGLKLSLKLYGTGHWKTLLFRATLAESLIELGLLVDAETTLLEALQESQAVEGLDRAWRFKCLVDLGRVYESQDRQDAAVDRFLQALELSREIYGTDHRNTQSAEGWLEGGIDLLTDRHDLDFKVTEPFYRKARDTWMSAYGNEHSRTIEAQARYARLLFGSWTQNKEEEKLRDATVIQKDLVTILKKKFGRDHEDTINALFELWKLYDWLGHTEDAREVGEELQLTSYGRDLLLGEDNVPSGCPVHRRGVPGADERG